MNKNIYKDIYGSTFFYIIDRSFTQKIVFYKKSKSIIRVFATHAGCKSVCSYFNNEPEEVSVWEKILYYVDPD